MPLWRHVYERLIGGALSRRVLTVIRYRTGLGADVEELRRRLEHLEATLLSTATPTSGAPPGPPLPTLGSPKACATVRDADLLEEILAALATRTGGHLRVLEWGSGLSTMHYPRRLLSLGVTVTWITLENDRDFFKEHMATSLLQQDARVVWSEDRSRSLRSAWSSSPGITAIVFDKGTISPFDPARSADRYVDLDDYVDTPRTLGMRFHAVIVDGRKRRRCLEEAASLLEDGGVALLHDAERPYYHCAFAAFRSGRRIGDQLWIGAQHDTDFMDLMPASALSVPDD